MKITFVAQGEVSLAGSNGSGFTARYATILDVLSRHHEVSLVTPSHGSGDPVDLDWHRRISTFTVPEEFTPGWAGTVSDVVRATRPDLVLVSYDWPTPGLADLIGEFDSIYFAEEDFSVHPNLRAEGLERLRRAVDRRRRRRIARSALAIVVISESEIDWAKRRFRPAPVHVIPHSVSQSYWQEPTTDEPVGLLEEPYVLTVGQFSHSRNFEGLSNVISSLPPEGLPFKIAAIGRKPPPPENDFRDRDGVIWVGPVDDLRPWYQGATAVLVPAFTVGGAKTTLLQGLASGKPVISSGAAARSIGATVGQHVEGGETPESVVSALIRVSTDPELQHALSQSGFEYFLSSHGDSHIESVLQTILDSAVASATKPL